MNGLNRLYDYKYGNNYYKSIFDNNILSSLLIILSDKQTSITMDEFNNAIEKAIEAKEKVEIKSGNHTIIVDSDKGIVKLQGKNSKGGTFNVKFQLLPKSLIIDNNCEVITDEYKIICDIPENFLRNATYKNETSKFILNDPQAELKSKKVNIFNTTAFSSITRALGVTNLSEDFLQDLLNNKKVSTPQGYAYFDENDKLYIYSNVNHTITEKTYVNTGNIVTYRKTEMTRIVKEEIKYDEKDKDIVLPLLQQIEELEQNNIIYEHWIDNWENSIRECPDDAEQYNSMIADTTRYIATNNNWIKELIKEINNLNNKR